MTVLDYGTLLSPKPIKLSIGSLRKPKLSEIYDITFDRFISYEMLLKLTPEIYYNQIKGEEGKAEWDSFSEEKRESIELYTLILSDESLQKMYIEILDFFFIESVVFQSPYFILLNGRANPKRGLTIDDISGVISEQSFMQILSLIQQTCCIYEKSKQSIEDMKFKNDIAKRMYLKMLKAQEEQAKRNAKKENKDHSLPNIISAVSNRHPCLNPNSVWELTVFQLIDSFNRLQINAVYEINQTRVSVWGDEKKAFDPALWYKNSHDN